MSLLWNSGQTTIRLLSYKEATKNFENLQENGDKSLLNFRPQMGQNFPFGQKEDFLWKFHPCNFYLLIEPYHAALGNSWAKIAPLADKRIFLGNST